MPRHELVDGMYRAVVLLDSVNEAGWRMTSLLLRFPRFILAEVNTHRDKSRSSNSSRARPVALAIKEVMENPYVPERFSVNRPGMQAAEYYEQGTLEYDLAKASWLRMRDVVVEEVLTLIGEKTITLELEQYMQSGLQLNVHKQDATRPLEPWMWHEAIVSGTHWANMRRLRVHKDAQPQFQKIMRMGMQVYDQSIPTLRQRGEWHLPFVVGDDEAMSHNLNAQIMISVARCAMISYKNPELVHDVAKDFDRYQKLVSGDPPHAAAFEHTAQSLGRSDARWGNLVGWRSHRYDVPNHDEPERLYRGLVVLPKDEVAALRSSAEEARLMAAGGMLQ